EANRASHRYDRLPLLPSGPGGFSRSWSCRFARCRSTKKSRRCRCRRTRLYKACSRHSGEIQVELHGDGFGEAVGFQIFEDVFVKLEFPFFHAAIVEPCEFDSRQADWIEFHQYFVPVKVALEILMYYIATLSHGHFLYLWNASILTRPLKPKG